jgi:hypothetical protein
MKTVKLSISLALIAVFVLGAIDSTSAQVRRRLRESSGGAEPVVVAPQGTGSAEDAHETNQQTRENRRNNASPNQKAATFNVANARHKTKETNKADASAAHMENIEARHSR